MGYLNVCYLVCMKCTNKISLGKSDKSVFCAGSEAVVGSRKPKLGTFLKVK